MSGADEQRGVVRRIEDGRVVVAVEAAACGGCAHAGGCAAGRLAAPGARLLTLPADAPRPIHAPLPVHAPLPIHAPLRVGDSVRLIQPEGRIVLSAVLGYLLPAALLVVGAGFGATLSGSDGGTAFGAVCGFLLALAAAHGLLAVLPGLLPSPRAVPLSPPATLSPQEYPDEP